MEIFGKPLGDVGEGEPGNAGGFASNAGFLTFGRGPDDPDNGSGSGSDSGDNGEFDPSIHISRDKRNADGSYRRKRARRGTSANSGNKARKNSKTGVEALTNALAIVHFGIAAATKTPELVLADEEAKVLAEASANVLSEFDIRPDPKVEAIFGLIVAAGSIYGPKAYLIRKRWKEENDKGAN